MYNVDAEQRVLAALIRHPDQYWHINEIGLVAEDFEGRTTRKVMRAIMDVVFEKNSPSLPFVLETLAKTNTNDTVAEYARELANVASPIGEAIDFAKLVKGLSVSRKLANAGTRLVEIARERRDDYTTALADADSVVRGVHDVLPPSERSPEPADILRRMRVSGTTSFIPLRFSQTLQRYTGGLAPGNLWVIGGFSSVGKSAVACNIVEDVLRDGKFAAIVSLEMTQEQYMVRMLSLKSGIGQRQIRDRVTLPGDNIDALHRAERELGESSFRIYDNIYNIREIRTAAKMMKETKGLDVLLIDFIQNVSGGRGEEVSDAREVILELQRLAKDLSCTVIAFSQVSNAMAQQHEDPKQQASSYYSFKGHGAIRDAADVGIMLKRNLKTNSPVLYLDVVKNRHDERGMITCKMELATGRIKEVLEFGEHTYDIPPEDEPQFPADIKVTVEAPEIDIGDIAKAAGMFDNLTGEKGGKWGRDRQTV